MRMYLFGIMAIVFCATTLMFGKMVWHSYLPAPEHAEETAANPPSEEARKSETKPGTDLPARKAAAKATLAALSAQADKMTADLPHTAATMPDGNLPGESRDGRVKERANGAQPVNLSLP